MPIATKGSVAVAVAVVAVAIVALWGRSGSRPSRRVSSSAAVAMAPAAARAASPSTRAARREPSVHQAPVSDTVDPGDEAALTARLRALWPSEPEPALALARAANERQPDGTDAPERAWIAIRSLEALGRFHEARDEARRMVTAYPGSSWSADVERHVLVHPLDHPSREEVQERMRAEAEPDQQ